MIVSSNTKTLFIFLLGCLLCLPIAGVPTQIATAQIPTPTGEYTTNPCPADLFAGLQTSGNIECGTLSVPEDHNEPAGKTIELSVVIIMSQAADTRPDPIFLAQGGPGGSTIGTFGLLLGINNPFASSRDVVLWDQRGTDFANPDLRCDEFVLATINTLDQVLSDEEEANITLDAMSDCRARYAAQNVNLNAFNSRQNAADAEALRKALGYDQINFYGVSYGSLLGFYLLDAYPQGLRTAVLDAVVLPQGNFLLEAGPNMYRSFNRLFASCRASAECSEAYPDLENQFYELIDRLNQQPAEITIANPQDQNIYPALLDGDLFLTAIFQLLYPTEYIAFLPKIIADASEGNYDFLSNAILPILLFDDTVSDGMYFSVICTEFMDYSMEDFQLDGLPAQIQEPEKRDLALIQEMCRAWDVSSLESALRAVRPAGLPVLLLSGEYDPITPPQNASLAAEYLDQDQSVIFPAGGHGQLLSGECQNQIVLDFLDNPSQPLDTSCISNEVAFITEGDILPLPIADTLFGTDIEALFQDLFWLGLVVIGLLGLFSALLVYPLRWIYRRITSRSDSEGEIQVDQFTQPEGLPAILFRLAHWLIVLAAFVLVVFITLTITTTSSLVLKNNPIVFYGFPLAYWPLFLLPLFFLVLGILIGLTAVLRWVHRQGSVLGRVYYTLLALSTLLSLLGLFQLGMFGIFFSG